MRLTLLLDDLEQHPLRRATGIASFRESIGLTMRWSGCACATGGNSRGRRIQNCPKEMDSSLDEPIFALNFLPFVALSSLRITARGLVNAKERRIVPLFAD